MNRNLNPRLWMQRGLRVATAWRVRRRRHRRVWIDVGAHEGETTMRVAAARPDLIVYGFEPNLAVAARSMGRLRNFVVVPMAVALEDGTAEFKVSAYDASSSLLDMDPAVQARWIGGGGQLDVVERIKVPTIRLDTFLNRAGIKHVDYLKVDAQGADLDVVRSAGDRLADIDRIKLEVTKGSQLYPGAADSDTVVEFMRAHGFELAGRDEQTYGQEENLTFVRR
jgi:FkbM family methyltransferase